MTDTITVTLTNRESQALRELSERMGLPMDRVMIQGLRLYQATVFPVPIIPMLFEGGLCRVCGIGFSLPSGACDHCNCRIISNEASV